MIALIQSENHAANKGKTAERYQFDTHPIGIGLIMVSYMCYVKVINWLINGILLAIIYLICENGMKKKII